MAARPKTEKDNGGIPKERADNRFKSGFVNNDTNELLLGKSSGMEKRELAFKKLMHFISFNFTAAADENRFVGFES